MIPVSLQISRSQTNRGVTEFRISIMDEISRIVLCETMLTPEEFALAITSVHMPNLKAQIGELSLIGRKKITRNEEVTHEFLYSGSDRISREVRRACDEVAARLNTETGLVWHPYYKDAENHHRVVNHEDKKVTHTVTFTAWENAEST